MIGRVETISGTATAVRAGGSRIALDKNSEVFQGDLIETGPGSSIGIRFEDKTGFSLGPGASMTLDEMVLAPAGGGTMALHVLGGAFAYVSGEIAKATPQNILVRTPVGAVGIRGTKFSGNDTLVVLLDEDGKVGSIIFNGQTILNQAGQAVLSDGSRAFLNPGQIDALFSAVLSLLPLTTALLDNPAQLAQIAPGAGPPTPEAQSGGAGSFLLSEGVLLTLFDNGAQGQGFVLSGPLLEILNDLPAIVQELLESLGGELAALVEGASEPPPVADGAIEADNVLVDAGNDVGPIDFFSGASTHPIAMALHDMFLGLFVTPALLDDFADFVDNEVNFPPENTEAENLALILATFPIFATMPQDGVDFFFAFAQSMEHGAGAGFSVRNQPADGSGVEDMDSTVPGGNADLSGFDSVPGPNPIVYTLLNEPVFGEVFALNGSALNHLSAGETFSEGDTLIWLYGLEELASFQYPDNGPLLDPNLDGFVPIPGLPTYSGPLSDFTPFDFDGMNSLPDDLLGEINFSTPIAAVSLNAHFAGLNATWAAYNTNGTATFEDDTLVASGVLVGSVNAAWPTGFEYNDYFLVDPAGDLLFDRVVVTVADDSVTGGQETFGHFHDNGILVAAPSVTFQYQVSDGVNSDIGTVQIDVGLVPIEFATV